MVDGRDQKWRLPCFPVKPVVECELCRIASLELICLPRGGFLGMLLSLRRLIAQLEDFFFVGFQFAGTDIADRIQSPGTLDWSLAATNTFRSGSLSDSLLISVSKKE